MTFEQTEVMFSSKTILYVSLTPSKNLTTEITSHLSYQPRHNSVKKQSFIPLLLINDLKITFKISNNGELVRALNDCICTVFDGREKYESINMAASALSKLYELERKSNVKNVFRDVYFLHNDHMISLDIKREEIYARYEAFYGSKRHMLDRNVRSVVSQQLFHSGQDKLAENVHQIQQLTDQINELKQKTQSKTIEFFKSRINELEKLCADKTTLEQELQSWVRQNIWVFGPEYFTTPLEKENINIAGKMPDFLLVTIDGYLDALEIKRANMNVLKYDKSRSFYYFVPDISPAKSQVIKYIDEINLHSLQIIRVLNEKYPLAINILQPRGILLIGHRDAKGQAQKDDFRRLNDDSKVLILTYTDLIVRGKEFINYLEKIIGND